MASVGKHRALKEKRPNGTVAIKSLLSLNTAGGLTGKHYQIEHWTNRWHEQQYEYLPLANFDIKDTGGTAMALWHLPHEV